MDEPAPNPLPDRYWEPLPPEELDPAAAEEWLREFRLKAYMRRLMFGSGN